MEITQIVCCRWEQCYLAQHASFHTQASALKTGQTVFLLLSFITLLAAALSEPPNTKIRLD